MSLDDLFTYMGIGRLVSEINGNVKPTTIGKTPLKYNKKDFVLKIGNFYLKYDHWDDLAMIDTVDFFPSWEDMLRQIGRSVEFTTNKTNYGHLFRTKPLKSREFDWRIMNLGVFDFVYEVNGTTIGKAKAKPLKIGDTEIEYNSQGLISNVGGLSVNYNEIYMGLLEKKPSKIYNVEYSDDTLKAIGIS